MDPLLSTAHGILQTHVSWQDIQEEITRTLTIEATFGPKRKVTQIAEGQGYLSRMCLVEPDWQGEHQGLPRKFLVKIASCLTMKEQSESSSGMSAFLNKKVFEMLVSFIRPFHNAEVTVYKIIAKHGAGRIPIPKIFASRMFDCKNDTKGFLVMEYLEDLVEMDTGDCINMEQLREILRYLARLQSLTDKITIEEKSMFTKNVFKELCQSFFHNSRDGLISDLNSLGDGCFRPFLADFQFCFDDLYSNENIDSLDSWNYNNGLPAILTHGDLWIANTLWTKKNGKIQMKALIDFQTSNLNIMASDLASLVTNLNGEERRAKKEEILETFYEYICEELEGTPPYTLEQLRLSFDKIFPVCAVEVLQGSLPFIENSRKKGEKTSEIVKKNFVMLMEDMIAYQKREIENRKNSNQIYK